MTTAGDNEEMRVTREVMEDIRLTVGCLAAETGGMLGGDRRTGVVTHYYFDGTARRTGSTYSPDAAAVNRVLSREWNPAGVELLGFVHSHPGGVPRPSGGDLAYARRILAANPAMGRVLVPIASSRPDAGAFEVRGFAAADGPGGVTVRPLRLDVVDGAAEAPAANLFSRMAAFSRVAGAYDLELLERSRVIAVGCGGGASFVEDLARSGVGEFVLVDPDAVAEPNLATQQTYRQDIGRAKVDCVADRIRSINPLAFVVACQMRLDDLDDAWACYLSRAPLRERRPERALLCGMTDDFYAQARINRLALNFGLPSLCAQVYAEGLGAEVTFTHPETTPACHRCVLRSRYRAYLQEGFVNAVGSQGTPLYATARLNALKLLVALALLQHGSAHPRWGAMAARIGPRNLVQLRLDPDLGLPGIERALRGSDPERLFCDEAVWLPQEPHGGAFACPDCGGNGSLRAAVGTRADTRLR